MTEKEAQNLICNNNLLLTQLLRVDKNNNIEGVPSFLKKISEATKTQCKKWVNTGEYKIGDIISYNSVVYICKVDNIDKNPELFKTYWIKIILPYASNRGKLKAFVAFKCNLDSSITILKSYNINYVSYITTGTFDIKLNSIVNNQTQSIFGGFVQTNTTNRNALEINTNTLSDKKLIRVQTRYTSLSQIPSSAEPIITLCVYNTDNTLY